MTQNELKELLITATEAMERLDAKIDKLIVRVDKNEAELQRIKSIAQQARNICEYGSMSD